MNVSKAIDKTGGVRADEFKVFLSDVVGRSGLTRAEIDSRCGFTMRFDTAYDKDPIGWGVSLPSPEKWHVIKDVLGVTTQHWDGLITRVWRGRAGEHVSVNGSMAGGNYARTDKGSAVVDAAKQWDGWGTALKPAWEPILLAQKPFSVVPLYEVANKTHHILGALKWLSLSPAKRAEMTSTSNRQGPHAEMCASVLANVGTEQSPERYGATGTFRSPEMALTYLNIEKLWQSMLGAISDPTIMFTTSTESSTITVLKTLNSLLGQITSATTMPPCECLLNGQPSNAANAESNSSERWSNWQATLNVSVPESVIEQTAQTALSLLANIAENLSQPGTAAGGGSVLSHAQIELVTQSGESQNEHANGVGSLTSLAGIRGGSVQSAAQQNSSAIEPIIVARKPLIGTVAANVLEHGTGALNIDACRVGMSDTDREAARVPMPVQHNDARAVYQAGHGEGRNGETFEPAPAGRFPANVLLDEHAAAEMDRQSGVSVSRANTSSDGRKQTMPTAAMNPGVGRRDPSNSHSDSGGASRFFPVFKTDQKCALFGMLSMCESVPIATAKSLPQEAIRPNTVVNLVSGSTSPVGEIKSGSSSTPANTAETTSSSTQETGGSSAQWTAMQSSVGLTDLSALCVGLLCEKCATAIARSVVVCETGHLVSQALGLPSTGDFNEQILTLNLVRFAESLAKYDTTSTTTGLMTSLGCAVDAISTYTTKVSQHATKRSGATGQGLGDLSFPGKYQAKAPKRERPTYTTDDGKKIVHSTVKPVELMRWLCRLVTPPGGTILEPFAGSGTTGEAAYLEGFNAILIEREDEYIPLIEQRMSKYDDKETTA